MYKSYYRVLNAFTLRDELEEMDEEGGSIFYFDVFQEKEGEITYLLITKTGNN